MKKNKKAIYYITLIPFIIILAAFVWLFTIIFEGELPVAAIDPLPEFISKKQEYRINIKDDKRGLKSLRVSYSQGGSEVNIFEKKFFFKGFLNKEGIRSYEKIIELDPYELKLPQGRVDLTLQVWDYSRRNGGDGNMTIIRHSMIVDTIPPAIRAISRMHNINEGGACLVIYRTSSDTTESGVYVDDAFFQGFPVEEKDGMHVSYFALTHDVGSDPNVYLWARDRADNTTQATFYYHILQKRFRKERIDISDSFLKRVLPYFSYYDLDPEKSDKDNFLRINNELRKEDSLNLYSLLKKTSPKKLWNGVWLRMKGAATTAKFADHREYFYMGEKIDEKYHMGVDLASVANSPLEAANNGVVVFAQRNGIYGLTVIIDHGQGIASLYGHLSSIDVSVGDILNKGDIIGYSGQTGLAEGDHLHYSMLVHGAFVNPIEWWDTHWIKDNITRKLDLLKN
ncbi:M23 family metallopeptidase [Thermodesulfobacteriota bacterium]